MKPVPMRDAILRRLLSKLQAGDERLVLLSCDFGSPVIDAIKGEFPARFINVGIAEQNLVNVATGLALEGFLPVCYAIAPFITMRCYEQIRVNLGILGGLRKLDAMLLGVGAGFSYPVSGPTHQALEDISIMSAIPGLETLSPCDAVSAAALFEFASSGGIHYMRLDGKAFPALHGDFDSNLAKAGFKELHGGSSICLVATGYMTQKAIAARDLLKAKGLDIGVVDVFRLQGFDADALASSLSKYKALISLEEAFVGAGGLDSKIMRLIVERLPGMRFKPFGLSRSYLFDIGDREALHGAYGAGMDSLLAAAQGLVS